MEERRERLRRWRVVAIFAVFVVGLGLLLTQCPSNRDGMPGQLAQAMDETTVAARSGAYALDLWIQRRSTAQFTAVALTDARDEVVNAYKGIAELKAEDPVDIGRQRMLTESMTAVITQLNAAAATIRHVTHEPPAERARDELRASADALESSYR
jgi:hypothetical protein